MACNCLNINRASCPSSTEVGAHFGVQVSESFGAGLPDFWRWCDFGVVTCVAKRALMLSSGAGIAPFSTPAPNHDYTSAYALSPPFWGWMYPATEYTNNLISQLLHRL